MIHDILYCMKNDISWSYKKEIDEICTIQIPFWVLTNNYKHLPQDSTIKNDLDLLFCSLEYVLKFF